MVPSLANRPHHATAGVCTAVGPWRHDLHRLVVLQRYHSLLEAAGSRWSPPRRHRCLSPQQEPPPHTPPCPAAAADQQVAAAMNTAPRNAPVAVAASSPLKAGTPTPASVAWLLYIMHYRPGNDKSPAATARCAWLHLFSPSAQTQAARCAAPVAAPAAAGCHASPRPQSCPAGGAGGCEDKHGRAGSPSAAVCLRDNLPPAQSPPARASSPHGTLVKHGITGTAVLAVHSLHPHNQTQAAGAERRAYLSPTRAVRSRFVHTAPHPPTNPARPPASLRHTQSCSPRRRRLSVARHHCRRRC